MLARLSIFLDFVNLCSWLTYNDLVIPQYIRNFVNSKRLIRKRVMTVLNNESIWNNESLKYKSITQHSCSMNKHLKKKSVETS